MLDASNIMSRRNLWLYFWDDVNPDFKFQRSRLLFGLLLKLVEKKESPYFINQKLKQKPRYLKPGFLGLTVDHIGLENPTGLI